MIMEFFNSNQKNQLTDHVINCFYRQKKHRKTINIVFQSNNKCIFLK